MQYTIHTGKYEWTRFEINSDTATIVRIHATGPATTEHVTIEAARELYRSLLQTAPPELQSVAKKFSVGQRVVIEGQGVADIIRVDRAVGGRGYTLRWVAGRTPGGIGDEFFDHHHIRLQTQTEGRKLKRYLQLQ